jgi:succinoglycan biosynthesis transport protein ExoP
MNRVTDAMRRAGQHDDDAQTPASAPDLPFVYGEDATEEPPSYAVPLPAAEPAAEAGPLVRRHHAIPIEVARSEPRDEIRFADVLRIMHRRRRLIAAVIGAAVATAVAYNRLATPMYEARARLLLEATSPEVVPFRAITEDQGRMDYYVTQLEVLRSRALARKTLERLQLLSTDTVRQSRQIDELLGVLTVTPVRSDLGESRVINVTLRSEDPKQAATLANGLAQTYVDQNLGDRRQGSRDASEWLNQRLTELRSDLNSSEGALQRYREEQNLVSLGEQQNIVVDKLAQISAALTTARTAKMGQQAIYQQLKSMQESAVPLDNFSPILTNTFIQGLKAEIAGLQRERGQMVDRLGDLHPDMIKVNTALAAAERRLKDEMAKVVEGVQNDFRAAEANEKSLASALEQQKGEVLGLNKKLIGYSALQRDAASTQQMFEAVRQRVKETELTGELQSNNAKILDVAEVPGGPVSPRIEVNLLIALMGGGFFALCLAFGVEYRNQHIADPGDIAEALGLPLLGVAPLIPQLNNREVTLDALPSSFREAIRGIRTRIFLSPLAAAARSLVVTSTNTGEGKTVVATNLAISLAMAGRRVLLVDADLRRPQLHRLFNIPRSPGLSDVMAGEVKPSEGVLQASPVPGLFVLASGAQVASPTDLLDRELLTRLIQGFNKIFDVVVLDGPPVMAVADASIIANAASSVLFVVSSGTTSREEAQVALDQLGSVQGHVIGVVLNRAKTSRRAQARNPGYLAEDLS